jgi:hypothetical protein
VLHSYFGENLLFKMLKEMGYKTSRSSLTGKLNGRELSYCAKNYRKSDVTPTLKEIALVSPQLARTCIHFTLNILCNVII